jgi:hypothetical protein
MICHQQALTVFELFLILIAQLCESGQKQRENGCEIRRGNY